MKPRVVLVDDDAESRRALSELLAAHGFEPAAFGNSEAAWAAIDGLEIRPDVVLTDMRMPGMDGVGLLRRIKSRFAHVPVILISAFADEQVWADALRAGAHDILAKPIRALSLIRTMRAAVGESHAASSPGRPNPDPRSSGITSERSGS